MNKKLNGYFTVEASFVIPLVLFLYMLIIVSGIFLYDRCVMSQDMYLIAFRGSRFSNSAPDYGEVIYAKSGNEEFCRQYVTEKIYYKQRFYPLFEEGMCTVSINNTEVVVFGSGFRKLLKIQKESERTDLFELIKKKRREEYA